MLGSISKEFNITSAVVQGSNLGLLLFLLFIIDITYRVSARSFLNADALKLNYVL